MIINISNAEKFPNIWMYDICPPGAPVPNDLVIMPCWKAGKYYINCEKISATGLYHDINLEELIRLDYKVPPGIAPQGENNDKGKQIQELADNDFNLLLIELDKFMSRGIKKVLHIDFLLDNERELDLIEHVMKHSTKTSHLEIQYPLTDTKPKLDYKDLKNSWNTITIRYGHGQTLETGDNSYA